MPGNRVGGLKAAAKNIAKNPNFYRDIGAIGGRNGNTGGFAYDGTCDCKVVQGTHKKAQCAGRLGGRKSRRKPAGTK